MKSLSLNIFLILLVLTACSPREDVPVSNPPATNPGETNPAPNPDPNPNPHPDPDPSETDYTPWGVGGGGAMSGVSISPYARLWFVGTDMGTLFRSVDEGLTWRAIDHRQAVFSSELARAVSIGFSSDGETVFHASAGSNPRRSSDAGVTFNSITMGLRIGETIRYWHSDSENADIIFAATTQGFLRSTDRGINWVRSMGISEEGVGTYLDASQNAKLLYHATRTRIWVSRDLGQSFESFYQPATGFVRKFTGGRDASGMTLAFVDDNGVEACAWATAHLADWGQAAIDKTINNCGYVWIKQNEAAFVRSAQAAGDHIKMAENDASTIYVTGSRGWIRQYGTQVHVSRNKGQSWSLKLNQINWDVVPYSAWPSNKIEFSAVALDVGWYDDGYESFEIHRRNSSIVSGSGFFFLHTSKNYGENWLASFTEYRGTGIPAPKENWRTRGIEVISVYKTKYHPTNPQLIYAASADIAGVVSEDAGSSWRITKAQYNSNYDYSFDTRNDQVVYAASGNSHDWPNDWHANAITSNGGIYRSINRGRSWTRLTPLSATFNRQFLSVGYDPIHQHIYGGTHETGIARSIDNGQTWEMFNSGLPTNNKIIPQIEIDPNNGNVYALLTGDAPTFSNQAGTGIYFLDVANNATSWQLLRGTVNYPPGADPGYRVWYYPTRFAIDFDAPSTLWLVDYENNRNWLMTGVWKTTNRGTTWDRMYQVTHPTDVTIDPRDPNRVAVASYYTLDGSWGNGGQLYTSDGGISWRKNNVPPLQQNSRSVTFDPTDSQKLIYSYFGGGMLSGPNPSY